MKLFFVVVLSAASMLSGAPAEAQSVDSGGFDARGICRRPEGCVVDHGQGGYSGPRNYRNFNGRNERNGDNDRDRNNRRYRSQNRSDNFAPTANRLAAGPVMELGVPPMQIRV
ncbi:MULTISPECIES: hypothetical protein [Rhizobium]|jgi:hypothetical protein|uniref:Uncharacterized protein n=1 Tax=Rhizobium anhuiense TaxID=1184720 RepID=A0A432NFV6_9HYPH|nr:MULTISPECIES: hypothetical protein [Rhizobium]MBB3743767.1 hypothetical protein [Rhizobium sp. BK591]MBB4113485.1 hypothetical protein [Rhizobium sp. BK226]MBB4215668.1 hypothetical protein [Rhizobium sp. BK212]MBB4250959.1 hypothetical protein [Rhizobium sp. BK008]NKM55852.1 hypothetical protein [Rhizobium anhuiense]